MKVFAIFLLSVLMGSVIATAATDPYRAVDEQIAN
jgi:hypothetical protein